MPVPGWDVRVLDAAGEPVPAGEDGAIVVKLPLPPGALPTLWNDDERSSRRTCPRFPGYYLTGDGGYLDEDGYLFVMGRTDDVINVAGHRLSTGAMEEVLAGHPAVAECAVIGVADALKGQVPRGFVVLKAGVDTRPRRLSRPSWCSWSATRSARWRRCAEVDVVPALPKTRSGKILRRTMRGDRRRGGRAGAVHDRGPGGAGRAAPDAEVLVRRASPTVPPASTAKRGRRPSPACSSAVLLDEEDQQGDHAGDEGKLDEQVHGGRLPRCRHRFRAGTSNSAQTARHTCLAGTPAASAWSTVRPPSDCRTWSCATERAYPSPKWSSIRIQNSDSRTATRVGAIDPDRRVGCALEHVFG